MLISGCVPDCDTDVSVETSQAKGQGTLYQALKAAQPLEAVMTLAPACLLHCGRCDAQLACGMLNVVQPKFSMHMCRGLRVSAFLGWDEVFFDSHLALQELSNAAIQ